MIRCIQNLVFAFSFGFSFSSKGEEKELRGSPFLKKPEEKTTLIFKARVLISDYVHITKQNIKNIALVAHL